MSLEDIPMPIKGGGCDDERCCCWDGCCCFLLSIDLLLLNKLCWELLLFRFV